MTAFTTTATALFLALALQAQPATDAAESTTQTEQAASSEEAMPGAEPATAPPPVPAPEPEKITDRNHPDYVRCRREPVIGSLAKFTRRCMTNSEWEQVARRGNEGTRSIVEDAQSGLNGN